MIRILLSGLFAFWTMAAQAQEVADCNGRATAAGLVEPWAKNSATFSNGKVRIAIMDMVEPAISAKYLMILSPPYNALGERQCRLIGHGQGLGFAAIYFDEITTSYDPALGLTFTIPALLALESGFSNGALLFATLNQTTGDIALQIELGME